MSLSGNRNYMVTMPLQYWAIILWSFFEFLFIVKIDAAENISVQPSDLPEPLTLEYALGLVEEMHPDMLLARARLNSAHAGRMEAESSYGLKASIQARARWVDPSDTAINRSHDDSHVGLYVNKRLYDFGRTRAELQAADAEIKSSEWVLKDVRAQRRIDILVAFFNVILADLEYLRDNEDMATAFVRADRTKDRNELGQISDVELLKAESEYQKARTVRYASDVSRRTMRARLAQVLNRPGILSANLAFPELPDNMRKTDEVDVLQQAAIENNQQIKAYRAMLQAASQRVQAARAGKYPVVTGEIEASDYQRELRSSDRLRAGITLDVPLMSGGVVNADIARRNAELQAAKAKLQELEMQVRQAVLEEWHEIYVLQAKQDEMNALTEYRDLYLDRSRGLYELDVKADLGDAMGEFSNARFQSVKASFRLALAWARLDALTGKPVYSLNEMPE